jgi:dUTP pyrophosphatase
VSFYYIEIETKGYYMGEIVKQNSKLKPRCCLLTGKCCKYSSDIEAAKAAEEIITKCRIPKDYISIRKVIDQTSSGNNFKSSFDNQFKQLYKKQIEAEDRALKFIQSKFFQNKINEIMKGDNMENSNQIEAPVKFGILEEEKVSRKFYPVKNAPADTVLPKRKTAKSAGYDFVLPCDVRLNPRSVSAIIPTNVKAFMPDDEVLMLYIRSSIGIKHHVTLANGTGIIDADYFSNPDNDGNIGICLQNNSNEIVSLKKGERIMQGIFVKYAVCDSDDTNEVRKGGFGSTGKE